MSRRQATAVVPGSGSHHRPVSPELDTIRAPGGRGQCGLDTFDAYLDGDAHSAALPRIEGVRLRTHRVSRWLTCLIKNPPVVDDNFS